ncbi:hypothetical protein ABZX92_31305 [Lentzea sp. NPDC006480]|uniref:hypothetical protein n=1 Tax=Lentzea sp. NPDC006480 TaxID=3157176 RepID=UPI0033A3587F
MSFGYGGATGYNVIADYPGGDANNVVMLGGHLDSVRGNFVYNVREAGSPALGTCAGGDELKTADPRGLIIVS